MDEFIDDSCHEYTDMWVCEVHPAGWSELLTGETAAVWPRNEGSEESSCCSDLLTHSAKRHGTRHEYSFHDACVQAAFLSIRLPGKGKKKELLARCCTGCVFNSDPQTRRDPRPPDCHAAPRGWGGPLTGHAHPKLTRTEPRSLSPRWCARQRQVGQRTAVERPNCPCEQAPRSLSHCGTRLQRVARRQINFRLSL